MQTIAILYKSCKNGISTMYFVKTPNNEFKAFGGITPKCFDCKSLAELKQAITSYRRNGFSFNKPSLKATIKSLTCVDPWSDIPSNMQQDLWALPSSV
jgi:hypothetical protein